MARMAGYVVSVDSRRPRAVSATYSPRHCPDFTLSHAAPTGAHVLVDVTTTSVTRSTALPAAAKAAGVAARGARAAKLHCYGAIAPHVVLPFVLEDAGALGKDAIDFVHKCKKKLQNQLPSMTEAELNWSNRGFSNYFFQSLSLANARGLGHYFTTAATMLTT